MADDVKRVQMTGGTQEVLSAFVGLPREVLVDTTNSTLTVHDGNTPGGRRMLPEDGDGSSVTVAGRALSHWFVDAINLREYAVGDGVADDTAAFNAWLDRMAATGRAGRIPAGTYRLTAAVTRAAWSGSFAIWADSPAAVLLWDTATGGLSITHVDIINTTLVEGVTWMTTATGGGEALRIAYPDSMSNTFASCWISGNVFRGADFQHDAWSTAIRLIGAWSGHVEGNHVQGAGLSRLSMVNGIYMTDCYDMAVSANRVFYCEYGLRSEGGEDEGVNADRNVVIAADRGISIKSASAEAGTSVQYNHCNCYIRGIDLEAKQQCNVTGNLIYKIDGSSSDYIGMNIKNGADLIVQFNIFRGFGSGGTESGIVLDNTIESKFLYNHFFDMNDGPSVAIYVGAGCSENLFVGNTPVDPSITPVAFDAAAAKDNVCRDNLPFAIEAMPAGTATPSVGNSLTGNYLLTQTGAQNVTGFTDGYVGQIIEVVTQDAYTTFVHSSGLILFGSVNFTAPAGALIRFRRENAGWREIGRDAPPGAVKAMTTATAAPSVADSGFKHYTLSQSAAQNVTGFTGGYVGQEIVVATNDGNTTFVHSASLIMKSGTSYAAPAGSVLTFRKENTLWREIARL